MRIISTENMDEFTKTMSEWSEKLYQMIDDSRSYIIDSPVGMTRKKDDRLTVFLPDYLTIINKVGFLLSIAIITNIYLVKKSKGLVAAKQQIKKHKRILKQINHITSENVDRIMKDISPLEGPDEK